MAFKVAGRPNQSGQNKAPTQQKPAASSTDQQAFSFKAQPPGSKPPPPRPAQPAATPAAPVRRTAPAAPPKPVAQAVKVDVNRWHGKSQPPPPRGSTYGEYMEWAADGLIPDEYTAALALDYYLGIRPDEPEPETSSFHP